MGLVDEIKTSCKSLEEVLKNYINLFSSQGVSEEKLNEFNNYLNAVKTIKENVNEENKEDMRNKLLEIQSNIDDLYLSISSKEVRL